jgi:hypothetical protein
MSRVNKPLVGDRKFKKKDISTFVRVKKKMSL